MSHHVFGAAGFWDVEDAVLADVALRRLPAHLERAGGGIRDLQVLYSAQSLCQQTVMKNGSRLDDAPQGYRLSG